MHELFRVLRTLLSINNLSFMEINFSFLLVLYFVIVFQKNGKKLSFTIISVSFEGKNRPKTGLKSVVCYHFEAEKSRF